MAPRYSPRKGVVTFDTFNREYWAHLPQHLTKGIGVFIVFFFVATTFSTLPHLHQAPSVAFGDFIGMVTESSL